MKTAFRRVRFALFVGLMVFGFISFTSTERLQAQDTRSGNEFDYYSDDTYSEQVGVWIWCSDGTNYRSGQTTPYYIISPAGC